MAGETVKTRGIVLDIRPWSRTSHVVSWLTPEAGPVTTLVKGATRPKSPFLGQYDLFYTCELVYYVRSRGEVHAIREASALEMREELRSDFRAAAIASYAAYLVKEHCPHNSEAEAWFAFLGRTLDSLCSCGPDGHAAALIGVETGFLALAGLKPDFSGAKAEDGSVDFAIDLGRAGVGSRTVPVSRRAARLVESGGAANCADRREAEAEALRFLGMFAGYHVGAPPAVRRAVLSLLALKPRK